MAQTTYNTSIAGYTEGQIVSDRLNSKIVSKEVDDSNGISFARFVGATDSAEEFVSNLYSNQAILTLSADLVASNVLAGNLNVNGTDVAYTETYASSHTATLAALAVEIAAIPGVLSAVSDPTARTITVLADPETDIYFSSGAVTLGGSQATVTRTNTCTLTILGPSVQEELAPDSSGVTKFADTQAVGVLRKGNIAIQADGTIAVSGAVYVRFFEESASNKKRGMLSTAAGSAPVKAIALTAGTYKVEQAMSSGALGVLALNNV